jgi:hypothetical protein
MQAPASFAISSRAQPAAQLTLEYEQISQFALCHLLALLALLGDGVMALLDIM